MAIPFIRTRFLNIYMWQIEAAVVLVALAVTLFLSGGRPVEYVGAAAVLFTFMHAQISDRMAAEQAKMPQPSVPCYKLSNYYYIAKEALWLVYFIFLHAWSALVGVGVFLLYPAWRRYYRRSIAER